MPYNIFTLITGVEMKFKNILYPVLIAPTHISELNAISHTEEGIQFGASVTLTQVNDILKQAVQTLPGEYGIQPENKFHVNV